MNHKDFVQSVIPRATAKPSSINPNEYFVYDTDDHITQKVLGGPFQSEEQAWVLIASHIGMRTVAFMQSIFGDHWMSRP